MVATSPHVVPGGMVVGNEEEEGDSSSSPLAIIMTFGTVFALTDMGVSAQGT